LAAPQEIPARWEGESVFSAILHANSGPDKKANGTDRPRSIHYATERADNKCVISLPPRPMVFVTSALMEYLP